MITKSIKTLVLIILSFSVTIKSQTIGQATVKTWAGDKKAAFSFTFDDSFQSQYDNARPVLNKYGFKATFYIIAGSIVDQGQQQIWRYGNWQEFKQMADEGHEMGAHTMTHPNLTKLPVGDITTPGTIDYELYQSQKLIEQKTGVRVITLAYPYTTNNSVVRQEAEKYFEASRAGNDTPNNSTITGINWQRLNSIEEQFNTPRSSFSDDVDELNNLEAWTQNLISNNQWGIYFAHEVLPYSEIPAASQDTNNYWYPTATEWLDSLCNFMNTQVNNNNIWVATVANVTKYIKERENFVSNIVNSTNSKIELSVTDNLNDTIFNYPLTVDIEVPAGWQKVSFSQGNNTLTLSTFQSGAYTYVRTNLIPDGGNVVLTDNDFTEVALNNSNVPGQYLLSQNYPNPFNPTTIIRYALPTESKVRIQIINLLGQEVATLINSTESAGFHEVKFNAANLASGIYIYRILAIATDGSKEFVNTKKMILLK